MNGDTMMNEETDNSIGNKLKRLRKLAGFSQAELALHVGVSKRTIQDWEADLKIARPKNLEALGDIFGVPRGWFHDSDQAMQSAVAEVVSDLEVVYNSLGRTLDRLKVLTTPRPSHGSSLVSEKSSEGETTEF